MAWSRIDVASLNHIYVIQVDSAADAETAMRNYYPASGARNATQNTELLAGDLKRVCTEFAFNPTVDKVNPVRLGTDWKVNEPGFKDVEWTLKAFVPRSTQELADNLLNPADDGDTFLIAFEWGTGANPGPDQFWVAGFGRMFGWPMEVASEGGILIEMALSGDGNGLWRNAYVRS